MTYSRKQPTASSKTDNLRIIWLKYQNSFDKNSPSVPNPASVPKAAKRNVSSEENTSLPQRQEEAGFRKILLKGLPFEYRVHFTQSKTPKTNLSWCCLPDKTHYNSLTALLKCCYRSVKTLWKMTLITFILLQWIRNNCITSFQTPHKKKKIQDKIPQLNPNSTSILSVFDLTFQQNF